MKSTQFAILLSTVILLGLGSSVCAAEQVTAKSFADPSGNLDQQRAAMYIVYRDKEPLSKFMDPGQTTLDPKRVVEAMADKLDDLRSTTRHDAPWTWQELDATEEDTLPAWKKIDGLTKKKEFGMESTLRSLGPVMLRRSTADLPKSLWDDETSLSDAKGATLTYSRNGLKSGNGGLNSEGVLYYPTMWNLYQGGTGTGRSIEMRLDLATEWNIAQVQDDREKDVEELSFSTPFNFFVSPGARLTHRAADAEGASSRLWVIQGKPYFQTDFDFQHKIYGVEATAEFVGNLFGSRVLYLGGFQNTGLENLQYQLRLIPKLDYSVTARGGIHTTRKEGDDWFRLGGTASFDLRLGLQTFKALDAGVSYQFLETVSGSGGFSYLFKAHTTLWLIENMGLILEFSKGDTPVADKPIDLIILGFEFKY